MSSLDSRENAEANYSQVFTVKTKDREQSSFLDNDLLLFHALWLIIILPKALQFVLLFFIVIPLLKRHKLYFDTLSYFLYSYILLYTFSIFLNLLTRSTDYIRVLAAFNSLSIWILALLFYLTYKNIDIDMKKFNKIAFINYLILIIVWVASIALHTITSLNEIYIMTRTLYYTEYFDGEAVTRFVGLMAYSNLIIMFCIFFYPSYFMHVRNFKSRFTQAAFLIIGILPIISSYSRSGYIILGTAITIGGVYYIYNTVNKNVFFFFFFLSSSILIAIFFITDLYHLMTLQVEKLLAAREGSNDSRGLITAESINITVRDSPIVGMGIKDISSNGYPLGSHSTFIGFFYKTGIVGLLLGTGLFIFINFKILLLKSSLDRKIISIFVLLMSVIFVVEDIDGANWLICIYFVFIGLLKNNNNWEAEKN